MPAWPFSLPTTDRRRRRKLRRLMREGRVQFGTGTYGTPEVYTFRFDDSSLLVGAYTSIGPNCTFILGGNHPSNRVSMYPFRERYNLAEAGKDGFPYSKGDIVVGSDVWLGAQVTVVSGVTIGHGSLVAAGTIVTKDIPPYAIFAGNPGRVLRYRFEESVIAELLSVQWWDWPVSEVLRRVDDLMSPPPGELREWRD